MLALGLALCLAGPGWAQWSAVSFNVVAHQDDWQLFFNPAPWNDIRAPGTKVVFVYTTAGDAGLGAGPGDRPYFEAREEGARRAVRFIANLSAPSGPGTFAAAVVNGHTMTKYTYMNTVSYFLRLPDGNRLGTGFATTGTASLERLRLGAIRTISAVDGSATYAGWNDLVDTLEMLVRNELLGSGARQSALFFQDSVPSQNRGDHSDHVNTGLAMDVVASRMPCLSATRFVDYPSRRLAANLNSADYVNKGAVFAVTVSGVTDMGHGTRWIKGYLGWLQRTYSRTTPGDGLRCFNPGQSCGPSTCGGCCDVDGVCQDGTVHTACGHGGQSCATCSSQAQACVKQVCAAVRPSEARCCDSRFRQDCSRVLCP